MTYIRGRVDGGSLRHPVTKKTQWQYVCARQLRMPFRAWEKKSAGKMAGNKMKTAGKMARNKGLRKRRMWLCVRRRVSLLWGLCREQGLKRRRPCTRHRVKAQLACCKMHLEQGWRRQAYRKRL